MVRTERAFLDELGIARLAAVAGGSLGGMQALEWAILYPDQVDSIVVIASTHAVQPQGVAWNAIARNAITADPDWQGGHYYGTRTRAERRNGRGADGWTHHLPLRDVGGGEVRQTAAVRRGHSLRPDGRPSFRSRTICVTRPTSFVKRFDANTYLYTSRALTYFDLARQYGSGALADALKGVRARTLLIAFSSDWLYPPSGSEELAEALRAAGKEVELHVIDAPYGHDCFLLEEARQTPMIQQFLAR